MADWRLAGRDRLTADVHAGPALVVMPSRLVDKLRALVLGDANPMERSRG
jgi:hypothetical protein